MDCHRVVAVLFGEGIVFGPILKYKEYLAYAEVIR